MPRAAKPPTRDEWLDALRVAEHATTPEDPNALTSAELADKYGQHQGTMQKKLRRLLAEGKVARTWKYQINSAGARLKVPAYRMISVSTK